MREKRTQKRENSGPLVSRCFGPCGLRACGGCLFLLLFTDYGQRLPLDGDGILCVENKRKRLDHVHYCIRGRSGRGNS
jgi:hypothetical protein